LIYRRHGGHVLMDACTLVGRGEADRASQAATDVRHGRRWPWLVLSLVWVLIVACEAVPVVYVVAPAVLGTWTADHGEGSPRAALAAFVYSFNDGPDATGWIG
jgi:ABC-type Fe3+ transport system permease subunit